MRIKQLGDPILRQVSESVEANQIDSDEIQILIRYMKDTLNGIKDISDDNGNALSAPQCGHLVRLILLRINGEFHAMINPEIVERSNNTFLFQEECFSFYNLRAGVERFCSVKVKYLNEQGEICESDMSGEDAGLVQHEIDHLDGIFFLDRVEDASQIQSIDYVFKDDQPRLTQLKDMMCYMTS